MSTYITHAIDTLRQNGFRITRTRERVIEILDHATAPLSPYDVTGIDPVTVYRIFECLEKNGLIHRVLSTGKLIKCNVEESATHTHDRCCHHLAICEICGTTREIHCHDPITIPDLPDMVITGHRLELIGRCRSCYAK
jgi:Fur family zinc uptake transcriptional regulator